MLRFKSELVEFIIILLKCFFILLVLGIFLPQIIDYILCSMYRTNIYDNSILVSKVINNNFNIINSYIYLFKLFLGV